MTESFSYNFDPSLAVNFMKLDARGKKAVKIILIGLCETRETGKEQKLIRIEMTPNNPFPMLDFEDVMRDMGIDISGSFLGEVNEDSNIIIFQPKPCENSDFLKGVIASREATNHFIKSFIDYKPSQVNSEPH